MKAQEQPPKNNDWFSQVTKDLKEMNITLTQIEVEEMSLECFKKLCKTKIKLLAFKYFEGKKEQHKAVKHIKYQKLEVAK